MESTVMTQLIDEICHNSVEAYDRLQRCLENKTDLEGNLQSSSRWAQEMITSLMFRAQKGNAPAMVFLGNAYLKGWGVEADHPKALNYARRAASLGNAAGESLLGFFYAYGYGGVVMNYERAIYWFKQAANKQYSMAVNNLGAMYENGWGVKKDINLALKYYRQAASEHNALALKNLERLSQESGSKK